MKGWMFAVLYLLFSVSSLFSQNIDLESSGTTRAVIIGISNYEDESIPDLRFADKDALAFANFLRSPAGGSLHEDQLTLMTNEQATMGNIVAGFDWLLENTNEGDQAIIYFSGHGDVEVKLRSQLGFLLPYNSPAKAYMAGAYPIYYLQNVLETLSIFNKAKVLLITDACRSGKLAGNNIGGSKLTSQNLAKQYANEIKILSCQPNEYSIEGEQWGGGRGAFSYHLVNGLYGMADANEDESVNLIELDRYLEDHVSKEVAPHYQHPITIGNGREKLFKIYPEILSQIEEDKENQMVLFASIETKGIEDEVLSQVDTVIRNLYYQFDQFLENKTFLEPHHSNDPPDWFAEAIYSKLIAEPKLEKLHSALRRKYAAALQDEAQTVLNKILKNDSWEINLSEITKEKKYRLYPDYLQRASDLLGKQHYMYPVLQARKLYFEGYLLHTGNMNPDSILGAKAIAKYKAALALQPNFPHPYFSLSLVYVFQMEMPDSAEYYAHRAVELAPSWFAPYTFLAESLLISYHSKNKEKIKHFLELSDHIDTNASNSNLWHMLVWSNYYMSVHEFGNAEVQIKKIIQIDSNFTKAHYSLGRLYYETRRYDEAEKSLIKSIALDSTLIHAFSILGNVYYQSRRYNEAEPLFLKAIQHDPDNIFYFASLGYIYNYTKRYAEADLIIERMLKLNPNNLGSYLNAAGSYIQVGRYDKAEEKLVEALKIDEKNPFASFMYGRVNANFGHLADAELAYKACIAILPNHVYAHSYLGLVYLRQGRYDLSESKFKEAIAIDSSVIESYYGLAFNFLHVNKLAEAKAHLEKASEIDSLEILTHVGLGLYHIKRAQFEEAEQELQMAKSLDTHSLFLRHVFACYALLYDAKEQADNAFDALERAFDNGYGLEDIIINFKDDSTLSTLRKQKNRWENLITKYFSKPD